MSQLILSRGTSYRRQKINKFLSNFELSPYLLIISLVTFVVLVTVVTLVFSTRQVTKGYVLNQMEAKHQDLARNGEIAEMEISKVKSLQYIQDSKKVRYMVKPREVVYVNGDTAIASK